jgi:hypothetical protein
MIYASMVKGRERFAMVMGLANTAHLENGEGSQ